MLNIIAESIIFVFCAAGLYSLMLAILRVPPRKVIKNISYLSRQSMDQGRASNEFFNGLMDLVANHLNLSENMRDELENQINTLEMNTTPEKYCAKSIVKGLLILPLAIPAAVVHPVFIIFVLLAAILVTYYDFRKIQKTFERQKEEIDAELPRFISVITETFKHDKNVIHMLETYSQTDETALTKELKIVTADMHTNNSEIALSRFSKRINSINLSEIVRGLIATSRGENTDNYFSNLSNKLSDEEDARVEASIMKLPSKIKRLVILNLANMGLIYAVVFVSVGGTGISNIFSM